VAARPQAGAAAADPADWPTVDVYIPSYNESLDIVKPTVFAALGMDWPADKFNVYILDDGRRPEFRAFAEEVGCGYIIRPDNKGAKAGNINHALKVTDGEFIVIFDCDHAPTRAFLQLTMGWMLRDRRSRWCRRRTTSIRPTLSSGTCTRAGVCPMRG
jgi:cellulose synthase (UDP-forming)